jgi:hypothetical protein
MGPNWQSKATLGIPGVTKYKGKFESLGVYTLEVDPTITGRPD